MITVAYRSKPSPGEDISAFQKSTSRRWPILLRFGTKEEKRHTHKKAFSTVILNERKKKELFVLDYEGNEKNAGFLATEGRSAEMIYLLDNKTTRMCWCFKNRLQEMEKIVH
ncbi:hypothetical protein NPIL_524561 [Nephila pilipes]|uniref:Uncharacterized protein n=1 Tax=Nephila pilipes TaxID=299642 RepID=A0A8X6UQD5_NEPPI|nr:hypothetical protein NPIL_524561 [Nephila pilipes]